MKTLRLTIDPDRLDSEEAVAALERAARLVRAGGLVAMPTETVYGLAANALDAAAVERIFLAKRRPAWDPIIVHIADPAMLDGLVTAVSEPARKLMDAYWPGPLTLLLPRSAAVPDAVTAGRPLVGVRMPAHPVALALIRRAGVPIAAPSANTFGHTSPTTAAHVLADLDGRIDAVLDAGAARHGVESTVVDPGRSPMIVYRPGAVTLEQIQTTAGPAEFFAVGPLQATPQSALPSPGVGLRHYAPAARLILIDSTLGALASGFAKAAAGCSGAHIGIMLPAELVVGFSPIPNGEIFLWGRWTDPEELAGNLYAGLRALDAAGCTVILCPMPPAAGVGAAIRDRLTKAATP